MGTFLTKKNKTFHASCFFSVETGEDMLNAVHVPATNLFLYSIWGRLEK